MNKLPKLNKALIDKHSTLYSYPDEEKLIKNVASQVAKDKFLTKENFVSIVKWKSRRQLPNAKSNEAEFIKEITMLAFSSSNEEAKIKLLTLLKGVNYRMASAILTICFLDKYTVMDYRVWRILHQFEKLPPLPKSYNYVAWKKYFKTCRNIASSLNISLRKLDRTLWQLDKEVNG